MQTVYQVDVLWPLPFMLPGVASVAWFGCNTELSFSGTCIGLLPLPSAYAVQPLGD